MLAIGGNERIFPLTLILRGISNRDNWQLSHIQAEREELYQNSCVFSRHISLLNYRSIYRQRCSSWQPLSRKTQVAAHKNWTSLITVLEWAWKQAKQLSGMCVPPSQGKLREGRNCREEEGLRTGWEWKAVNVRICTSFHNLVHNSCRDLAIWQSQDRPVVRIWVVRTQDSWSPSFFFVLQKFPIFV